jgi:hypothetical protein
MAPRPNSPTISYRPIFCGKSFGIFSGDPVREASFLGGKHLQLVYRTRDKEPKAENTATLRGQSMYEGTQPSGEKTLFFYYPEAERGSPIPLKGLGSLVPIALQLPQTFTAER